MSKKNTVIYAEDKPDYKYQSIMQLLDVEYRYLKYDSFILRQCIELLKGRLKVKSPTWFHIRYIKWRGWVKTIPIYLIIILLCKLRGMKILWTCHNIREHFIPSNWQNKVLLQMIFKSAKSVIVFHEDLVRYLPKKSREKVFVANFGSFRKFVESQKEPNEIFAQSFYKWQQQNNCKSPDLIFISAAFKKTKLLLDYLSKNQKIKAVVISPLAEEKTTTKNALYHTGSYVKSEIQSLLKTGNPIGYFRHDNISVPTSVYMFASYGVPMVALNNPPITSLLEKNGMGLTFDNEEQLEELIRKIRENYSQYQRNALNFIEKNSWEESAIVHSKALNL